MTKQQRPIYHIRPHTPTDDNYIDIGISYIDIGISYNDIHSAIYACQEMIKQQEPSKDRDNKEEAFLGDVDQIRMMNYHARLVRNHIKELEELAGKGHDWKRVLTLGGKMRQELKNSPLFSPTVLYVQLCQENFPIKIINMEGMDRTKTTIRYAQDAGFTNVTQDMLDQFGNLTKEFIYGEWDSKSEIRRSHQMEDLWQVIQDETPSLAFSLRLEAERAYDELQNMEDLLKEYEKMIPYETPITFDQAFKWIIAKANTEAYQDDCRKD